jgi:WD40 repeat protein
MKNCNYWFVILLIALCAAASEGCDSRVERGAPLPPPLPRMKRRSQVPEKTVPVLTLSTAVRLDHRRINEKERHSRSSSVLFPPGGRFVVTVSGDVVRFWRLSDYQEQFHVPKSLCSSLWFSEDGQSFLSAVDAYTLCWRSTADGHIIRRLPPRREEIIVEFTGFSMNGKAHLLLYLRKELIVAPSINPFSYLITALVANACNFESRIVVMPLADPARGQLALPDIDIPREQALFDLSMMPAVHSSGRAVIMTNAALTADPLLRTIDLKSGKTGRQLLSSAYYINKMQFSEDGSLVGTLECRLGEVSPSYFHKFVRLFDYETGRQLWFHEDTTDSAAGLEDLAFSPDGKILAIADTRRIRLREMATGQEILRITQDDKVQDLDKVFMSLAFSHDGKKIAAGTLDGPVWVWSIAPMGWSPLAQPLDIPTITTLWNKLAETNDAPAAYRAVWALAASSATVVPFLAERITAVPKCSPERISQLIADLDNDDFLRREAATRELSRLGTVAGPALRKALENSPSAELRRRAEPLLKALPGWIIRDPETLRIVRAIWVLQRIGSLEARAVLKNLAAGAPAARQTQEAKSALQYLDHIKK